MNEDVLRQRAKALLLLRKRNGNVLSKFTDYMVINTREELDSYRDSGRLLVSNVFERNYKSSKRFIINEGGTRSSKTISMCQLIIVKCFQNTGLEYDIVRKTTPALKATVMKDFLDILIQMELYSESFHNKTDKVYKLNGNAINFYSLDEPQKIRGRKRNDLWLNEANEFTYEDFMQFNMRTVRQMYFDYNPSDISHWIYDKVLTRDNTELIRSTYKDNPFLDQSVLDEIEQLKVNDSAYWKIYGLGERPTDENDFKVILSQDLEKVIINESKNKIYKFLGIDIGQGSPDLTVVYGCNSDGEIWELGKLEEYDTMKQVDWLAKFLDEIKKYGGKAVIDTGDAGQGVYDRLRQLYGDLIIGYKFGEKSDNENCYNKRAEFYYLFRQSVQQQKIKIVAPNNELKKDISATFYLQEDGKFRIEPKKNIKKRIGRSPDRFDSIVLCNYAFIKHKNDFNIYAKENTKRNNDISKFRNSYAN